MSDHRLVVLRDNQVPDFFRAHARGLNHFRGSLLDLTQFKVKSWLLREVPLVLVVLKVPLLQVSDLEVGGVRGHLQEPTLDKVRLWRRGSDIKLELL